MAAGLIIDVLSLFPEMVEAPLGGSILGKAREKGLVEVRCHNIRDWTVDKHRKTDDYLCGGGQGMLLKPEPIFAAVEELRRPETRVVLMTPQGRTFNQSLAGELAASGGTSSFSAGIMRGWTTAWWKSWWMWSCPSGIIFSRTGRLPPWW